METQTPIEPKSSNQTQKNGAEFAVGSMVIYGLHGKCQVVAVENREINGQMLRFYKLEIQKSSLSRSSRNEPAIWLPVSTARDRGLRPIITNEEARQVLETLGSREYYFPINEHWNLVLPKLEACIRSEGAIGLAKATSYLYVLKRRQIVPSSELVKFQENVNKLLLRELSEVLGEPIRDLEDRISKALRQKLIPDT